MTKKSVEVETVGTVVNEVKSPIIPNIRVKGPRKPHYSKPSQFQEKWTGQSPYDLNSSLHKDEIPRYSDKEVLGIPLGIHGYIKLQGSFKGKNRPFVVMSCTSLDAEDTATPFTVSSSGMVVIKKLEQIGEKEGFPIAAQIIMVNDSYFDLADVDILDDSSVDI